MTRPCPRCQQPAQFSRKRGCYYCAECEVAFEGEPAIRGRVFLSYGHDPACTGLVERLRRDLTERGWEPWIDTERIRPDDEWRRTITEGLQTSRHVVALLSRHSMRPGGVCRQEVALALGPARCSVFTVLVEPASEVRPPLIVSHRQWLDMQDWLQCGPAEQEALYQRSLQEILRVLEGNEPFAGEIDELHRWLDPLDGTADMVAAEREFEGRQWLLGGAGGTDGDDPEAEPPGDIERWRTSGSPNRLYWLAAEPGWGKSAVAARLAHAGRARVLAVHFCRYERPATREAQAVLRTIAFQMATQLGEYRRLLVERARSGLRLELLNAPELFHELLANPLTAYVIEGGRGPHDRHLIVLDALDEALDGQGRSELLKLVAAEFTKLPAWIGLLVTSRPEAPIVRQLGAFGIRQMQAGSADNLRDVSTFIRNWISSLPLDPAHQAQALSVLMDASAGNFLYVRQLREAVRQGVLPVEQLVRPAGVPRGLAGLYERWFQQRFGAPGTYERTVRPLLELLLAAREPLPADLASAALGWDVYTRARAIETLGTLAATEDDTATLRLFHKSLRDWLADLSLAGHAFHASEAVGHQRLATTLLGVWREWKNAGAGQTANAPWRRLGTAGERYALRHLPAHLEAAGLQAERCEVLTCFALAMRRCESGAVDELLDDYRGERGGRSGDEVAAWAECLAGKGHLLRRGDGRWPAQRILLQVAVEDADESPLTHAAEAWLRQGHCDWVWVRNRDRPRLSSRTGLLAVLEGHTGPIGGATVLPNRRIVSWSDDHSLRIWDGQSGAVIALLEGHESEVLGATMLPDGRVLSWSLDHTLRLWHSQTGAALAVLEGHTQWITDATVMPDGRILSWSEDGTLRLWDEQTGAALAVSNGHAEKVDGARVLPDGRILSWSDDHTLRMWDGQTGATLAVLEGHAAAVIGATSLPDGRILSWSHDHSLRLWDVHSGAEIALLEGHEGAVFGATILPGGRILSWSEDGTMRLWDDQSGTALAVLEGHAAAVMGATTLPDGRVLSWSEDSTLRLWNGQNGDALGVLEGHLGPIIGATVLPDHSIISWALGDDTLRLWDGQSGTEVGALESHMATVVDAIVLPDGRILSWSSDHTLRLWGVQSNTRHAAHVGHTETVNGATVLPGGMLLSWSEDGTLRLWDSQSGAVIALLEGHESGVLGAIVLPDSRVLSWSRDHTLRLWDGHSGAAIAVMEGHTEAVIGAGALPDGRMLSWSSDGTLRLWDDRSGIALGVMEGHPETRGVKVLPDSRMLSWSSDHILRLWDCLNGYSLASFQGHNASINGASLLEDGRVLSWSTDGTIRLWDGQSGSPLAVLKGPTQSVLGAAALSDGRILSWTSDQTVRLWGRETGAAHAVLHQPWIETSPQLSELTPANALATAARCGSLWAQAYGNHITFCCRNKKWVARWHGETPEFRVQSGPTFLASSGRHLLFLKLMRGAEALDVDG
jgi:WD40 repeat protein